MKKYILFFGLYIGLRYCITIPCPCIPNIENPQPFFLQETEITNNDDTHNDESDNDNHDSTKKT